MAAVGSAGSGAIALPLPRPRRPFRLGRQYTIGWQKSDDASKAAFDHAAGTAAYAASKAAAVAMMDSLAADLKGTGVRVNSILPSIIDTEANRKAMPKSDFAKWPKPEDIARVILFLCGDDAKVVHGAALPVYGDS